MITVINHIVERELSVICFVFRINVDGNSLDISYEEWRDYLLFHPSSDLASIINSWRHNTVSRNKYYE